MKTRLGLVGREDGFLTLLEAILTMVIVLIFLMLPSLNIEQAKLGVETDLFTENLRTQITLMNQNAVLKGEMSVVEVEPGRNRIIFSVMGQPQSPLNSVLPVPDHIKVYGGYKRYAFRARSGNITKVNRFAYTDGKRRIEFVFQIGSGRFYVRES